jgi:hypothetical protein
VRRSDTVTPEEYGSFYRKTQDIFYKLINVIRPAGIA